MTKPLIEIVEYAIRRFSTEANVKRAQAYEAVRDVILAAPSIYDARETLEYGAMLTPDATRRDVFNHVLHMMDLLRDI